jgi:hypothetical protein
MRASSLRTAAAPYIGRESLPDAAAHRLARAVTINAIVDALWEFGVRHVEMPATGTGLEGDPGDAACHRPRKRTIQ